MPAAHFIHWIEVQRGKFYNWVGRYGKANEHNALVPRDHWIEAWERDAILAFHAKHTLEGYRRLAFMMLDAGAVAVSPTTVWRVLSKAGVIDRWNRRTPKKGTGFVQPLRPHEHWHATPSGGHFLRQRGRHVLLPLLDPRWLQPRGHSLGPPSFHG